MLDAEQAVATYLTLCGQVFIASQYRVPYDEILNEGGSEPDFVALDLCKKEVIVVEVSMAADRKRLIKRIDERQTRWYQPIRRILNYSIVDASWSMRFIGFIRHANCEAMADKFIGDQDVVFKSIEEISHSWHYWDDRIKNGLPKKYNSNSITDYNFITLHGN